MRSLLCLALVGSFAAFAQDDFYARQLEQRQFENRQYETQLQNRQFEAQRVEQQRVRRVQDRQDQADTDARFQAQQAQRQSIFAPRPQYIPNASTPGRLNPAPACPTLDLGSGTIDAERTGVFGTAPVTTVQFSNGFKLVVTSFSDRKGIINEIGPSKLMITLESASGKWFATSGEVDELDVVPVREQGTYKLVAHNIRFAAYRGKLQCVRLGYLKVESWWSAKAMPSASTVEEPAAHSARTRR